MCVWLPQAAERGRFVRLARTGWSSSVETMRRTRGCPSWLVCSRCCPPRLLPRRLGNDRVLDGAHPAGFQADATARSADPAPAPTESGSKPSGSRGRSRPAQAVAALIAVTGCEQSARTAYRNSPDRASPSTNPRLSSGSTPSVLPSVPWTKSRPSARLHRE